MGAWAPAQGGIQPMASWRSKVTPCPRLQPRSRQEATSHRRRSLTSTSALSTGLWCSGSAACYRCSARFDRYTHETVLFMRYWIIKDHLNVLILLFFLPSCYFYLAKSEHSPVLSECTGVALLSDRQQKQNWVTSGPPAHRPVQLTNAWRKYCLHTAGTKVLT